MAILQKKTVRKLIKIFTGLLFLAIFFLRFFKVGDNFIFDIDTQYQALLAKTIIEDFHIIWIGVSASNVGYYLGPGLVYLTAFLLSVSKGDPLILGYFASFVGFITVLSLFYITKKLFNLKIAFIATVIYGFSSFIISYDRKYWPILVPLIAIWQFYSLIKAQSNSRWLILSSIFIAFSYHIHFSLFIFWPFIIWTFFKLFKKIDWLTWCASISSYLLITLPLLVFDYVHNFDNLLMPIKFIKNMLEKPPVGLNLHFNYFFSSIGKVWIFNNQNNKFISIFLTVLLITILLIFLKITYKNKNYVSTFLSFIIFLFIPLFIFFPGYIQEYYLVFIFPFLAIACGLVLEKVNLSIAITLISIFIVINLETFFITPNTRGLNIKKELIKKVIENINGDYYLSYDGKLDMEGWRYLFEAYGKMPSQSKADEMFGWIYPKKISKYKPEVQVFVSTYDNLHFPQLINKFQSGKFTAYILENIK